MSEAAVPAGVYPLQSDPLGSGTDFSALLRNLWRSLVKTTRATEHLPELAESQVDVLRALAEAGSMTPGDLAEKLRLARPTVSNVIRDLTSSGMIERRRSGVDGRSAILVPTDQALDVMASFARARVTVIETVLARMDADDIALIEAAVPALNRLLAQLETELAERGQTR